MNIMSVSKCGIVVSMLLLTGCKQAVDLAGVRTLAATVKDAEPSYTTLANNYYTVCIESAGWQKLTDFTISPTKKLGDDQTAKAICDGTYKPVTDAWNNLNGVVIGYISALGSVAGGQKATDFGLGTLTSNIKQLTSAQGSALSAFLNALANEAFDAKRRTAIADTAPGADSALQTLVALQVDAANNYKAQLGVERGHIDSFYRDNFALARRAGKGESVTDQVQWQSKLDDVDRRSAAADAYVASVQAIAAHHRVLLDEIENNHFDQLYAISLEFVTEFKPKVEALSKAFP
jgi:hypothetical protein